MYMYAYMYCDLHFKSTEVYKFTLSNFVIMHVHVYYVLTYKNKRGISAQKQSQVLPTPPPPPPQVSYTHKPRCRRNKSTREPRNLNYFRSARGLPTEGYVQPQNMYVDPSLRLRGSYMTMDLELP